MTRRIGLFGGTFDPVHNAHVALAHAALQSLRLDAVWWLPSGAPWQKVVPGARPITPAAHREAMVREAIAGVPGFVLERHELEQPGPHATLQTLRALQAREADGHDAEWVLLIGGDQYANLHTWRGWPELLQAVTLAVAARPGVAARVDPQVLAHPHRVVPLPPMDLSATDIRRRIAAGEPWAHLVPAGVARYIDQQALYRADPGS